MASGGRRGAGERVLESKHVIGLFLLMLVFSGVFFTLGYVMGRSQYDGQVRAASTNFRGQPQPLVPKTGSTSKSGDRSLPGPSSDLPSQPASDWTFYKSAKSNSPDESLKPVSASRGVSSPGKGRGSKSLSAPATNGAYTLQVAALRKESDAFALAAHLQSKKFPAYVAVPQGDKYYRVQVGPYSDQKSAEAARKGLEGAGFKAIVKH
jgi:cell division septation protein DedD